MLRIKACQLKAKGILHHHLPCYEPAPVQGKETTWHPTWEDGKHLKSDGLHGTSSQTIFERQQYELTAKGHDILPDEVKASVASFLIDAVE